MESLEGGRRGDEIVRVAHVPYNVGVTAGPWGGEGGPQGCGGGRLSVKVKGVEGNVEEADPVVGAGDIALWGTSVAVEGAGSLKGGRVSKSFGARPGPGVEGPG